MKKNLKNIVLVIPLLCLIYFSVDIISYHQKLNKIASQQVSELEAGKDNLKVIKEVRIDRLQEIKTKNQSAYKEIKRLEEKYKGRIKNIEIFNGNIKFLIKDVKRKEEIYSILITMKQPANFIKVKEVEYKNNDLILTGEFSIK